MSVGLGTACTVYEPAIVLEALCLTAAIVVGLTLYTFYAVRKGVSFQRLGPILFCGEPSKQLSVLPETLHSSTPACLSWLHVRGVLPASAAHPLLR